jgi:hypothetical protein
MSSFPIAKRSGTKVTEFTNADVSALLATKAVGKDILNRDHLDNVAAKAAGLLAGDLYHTAGFLKVVV